MSERQGRELDVFLAEHACGMRFISKQYSFSEWRGLPLGAEPMECDLRDNYVPVLHYSTNDTDALLLLDAMRAKGWHWLIEDEGEGVRAVFYWGELGIDQAEELVYAEAPTLTAAISRAAERALEGDDRP